MGQYWAAEQDIDSSALLRQWLMDRSDPASPALHSERVALLGASLAHALGIEDTAWLEALRLGCAVHDIGKLAVPEQILKKPGALTPDERETVRRHPEWGALLVERLGMSGEVLAAVRHHHEHWDGTGYPDGLSGDSIPLAARVVRVVDVYDALTSDRSYRSALPREEALRVMDEESGRTMDPNIYRVFRDVVAPERPGYS